MGAAATASRQSHRPGHFGRLLPARTRARLARVSQADRCLARALWDLGDLKTSRRGSRVYRPTRTNPVRRAGRSIWGNERDSSAAGCPCLGTFPPTDSPWAAAGPQASGRGQRARSRQSRGPGHAMAGLRKGTWSGSGRREQEEGCRELGAVTVVRTPRAVGSSALCPLATRTPPLLQTASRPSFGKAHPTATPACLLKTLQKA